MPASLPGDTKANNTGANPAAGMPIIYDLLSGPKGSPFDKDTTGNASTGGLSTGIGYGINSPYFGWTVNPVQGMKARGYTDDYIPGASKLDGTAATDSRFMYIGGGKSTKNAGVTTADKGIPFLTSPYTAGYGIGAAGNGGSRDAGAGPAFTGFTLKLVHNAGAVAIGAAVEAGWLNRTGVALNAQAVFGSSNAASAAVA